MEMKGPWSQGTQRAEQGMAEQEVATGTAGTRSPQKDSPWPPGQPRAGECPGEEGNGLDLYSQTDAKLLGGSKQGSETSSIFQPSLWPKRGLIQEGT